ncbi:YidB family protein [Actinoplanes solisilvae]|uniref:YidB family protein n=1 Tax=Actinoplanes solisilvae TaxID=2486853 RepID=UPI000FD8ECEC|nr:YidB family protein [Actinoplanes solisilvae]
MTDIAKLSTLLDDPGVRDLLYGLAYTGSPITGPARLQSVVLRLAETTTPEQYGSWLSDVSRNQPMTVDQVRSSIGEGTLDDIAQLSGSNAAAVAWQLTSVLPDLVDAASPGGRVVAADVLGPEIFAAIADDERSAGAFG